LVIGLSPHSSSFSEGAEEKMCNEKIEFMQIIIHDIDRSKTFAVGFLHKSKRHWHANAYTGLGATLVDQMFIEELEEDEVVG
jgi:hypothetical protein